MAGTLRFALTYLKANQAWTFDEQNKLAADFGQDSEIGFVWVCFFAPPAGEIFYNPLYILSLQSAYGGQDWVCFA